MRPLFIPRSYRSGHGGIERGLRAEQWAWQVSFEDESLNRNCLG